MNQAQKKLVDRTAVGQAIRSKKGEHELEKQKEVALKFLKDAAKYEPTVDLVLDDSYNDDLIRRVDAVELKID